MSRFDFNDFRNQNSGSGNGRNQGDNGNRRGPLPPGLGNGSTILALIFVLGFAVLLGAYKGVENISAMDIFLMAAVAFVITRLVRRNAGQPKDEQGSYPDKNRFRDQNRNRFQTRDDDYEQQEEDEAEAYWRRREEEEAQSGSRDGGLPSSDYEASKYDPWDRYRSLPQAGDGIKDAPAVAQTLRNAPQGFDRNEFLAGAKILFEKIQEAVAAKDLAPVESFLTDRADADLERELASGPVPQSCTVLSIEASIRDIREKGDATVVSVNYEAVVHFGDAAAPQDIKATWRFQRDNDEAVWQLDSTHA